MPGTDVKPIRLVSVDLGQKRDWTAISVTERVPINTGEMVPERYWDPTNAAFAERHTERIALDYRVRHLERPPLGTPYPEIVERVIEIIKALGGPVVLLVDQTGVGVPVVDMFRERLNDSLGKPVISGTGADDIRVTPGWITITGGDTVTRASDGSLRVPKRDLVSAPLVLMQNGQLKIADGLSLKDTLVRELLNFRVKINVSTAHDSYEAWREGDHDDLVLSLSLACWAGERFLPKPVHDYRRTRGSVLREVAERLGLSWGS